jgi:zinc protease
VSIRIIADVSSLYETEAQRGYAHLIEHLTFRDSKYLKGGEAIPTWQEARRDIRQRHQCRDQPDADGLQARPSQRDAACTRRDVQAAVGHDRSPDLHAARGIPKCRSCWPKCASAKGRKPRRRCYPGRVLQGAAARRALSIGTVATLQAATAQSVKDFHDKWYRPDNTVIVVSGDADTSVLVAELTKWFGDWKAVGKKPPQPDFGAPVAPSAAIPKSGGRNRRHRRTGSARVFNAAILRPGTRSTTPSSTTRAT